MAADYVFAFFLTSAISLFSQVVFVFGFVKLKEPRVKEVFRFFFFSSLIFSVSQITLLIATVLQGFRFDFFINWNSFFSFVMAILLLVMIREAEDLSRKILAEEKQNGA